jgi:hypothetical protein
MQFVKNSLSILKEASTETPMAPPEPIGLLKNKFNSSYAEGVMPQHAVSTERFGDRSTLCHDSLTSDSICPSDCVHSKEMFFEKQQFL